MEFCEDMLIETGHINRTMLSDYFGVEKSTGSMDIAAYIAAGGPIRRALRHETPVPLKEAVERGIGAGRPKGSQGYYVHTGGAFITGSSEERRAAWELLPCGQFTYREWLSAVMGAYLIDNGRDELGEYFGITDREADKVPPIEDERVSDRARVWEYFK